MQGLLCSLGAWLAVDVLAPELGTLLLAAGGNRGVVLNHERVAADVDQESAGLQSWCLEMSDHCRETNTFVCLVLLGSIVHLVVSRINSDQILRTGRSQKLCS